MPDEITKNDEMVKLRQEAEKLRAQFYIFYELTKAMRTTLRMDEIVYIILTGVTAHQGLAFNRAIIFLIDEENKKINGFMGMGPMDGEEADDIWQNIESEKKDLYDLIETYRRIKEGEVKPRFMEFVKTLSFPLSQESGILYTSLFEKGPLRFKGDRLAALDKDPLVSQLKPDEVLLESLWIQNRPAGLILVDNCVTKKPISDEDVRIFNMFVEQASGAIENSQAYENTLNKAHTDQMTGLWNYGYFQYRLDEELEKAKREQYNLTIAMVDIDDFKKFNDTYGHLEGDHALKALADIFRKTCRKVDIVCRYGGEEFSLIIPGGSKEEVLPLAERIRRSVAEEKVLTHNFTISIGLATFPKDGQTKDDMVRKADVALYRAKTSGKNKICLAE